MNDNYTIDDAVQMYMDGASMDQVKEKTGIELRRHERITPEVREVHIMKRHDAKYVYLRREWDPIRFRLLNSGYDLSRIQIVEEEDKEEDHDDRRSN